MREAIQRLTAPLAQRVRLSIGLALVNLIEQSTGLQRLQVTTVDGVRTGNRMQNYGHASAPLAGAQAVPLAVGGNRNHLVFVAVDDGRYVPSDLTLGESCLYTDEGDRIWLKRGRIIAINAGTKVQVTAPEATFICSTKVTLQTPECDITGNLTVAGGLAVTGNSTMTGALAANGGVSDSIGSLGALRTDYNAAKYPLPGGGTTGTTDHPA